MERSTAPPLTSAERVQRWVQPTPSPPVRSPVHMDLDDVASIASGQLPRIQASMYGQFPPQALSQGQTPFDWDVSGHKTFEREEVPPEVEDRLQACEDAAQMLAATANFRQEPRESVEVDETLLSSTPHSTPISQTTIPLPRGVRSAWEEARRPQANKPLPLTPQTVRRGYRLPRDDWAFLGAVRRPDPLLANFSTTKDSAKGVPVLQAHKNIMDHVAWLHDNIQATAHAQRPLTHAAQALSTLHKLLLKLPLMLSSTQSSSGTEAIVSGTTTLARLAYTAVLDTSECLARLNSEALRRLRGQWLEQARFPSSVKEAVKRDPLPPGVAPTQERVEFTAPLVGDTLPLHYDEAYNRAKSEQVLSKKAQAFKPPQVKRRQTQGGKGAPSGKRQKTGSQQSGGKGQQGSSKKKRSRPGKGQSKGQGKGQGKGPQGDKPQKGS